jgi:transcriptional regulator with XRE-family HTH domain
MLVATKNLSWAHCQGMTEDKPYADIGHRLRWHRDLLGVDQAVFVAKLPSVKRQAYSNWESGSTRLSLNGALEIRRAYGLSLDFMYEGIADTLPMSLRQAWLDRP